MPQITVTPQEAEEYFHNALCNGLGYFSGYGIILNPGKEYDKAKVVLGLTNDHDPCYEDILLQILKNGDSISFVDEECDGEYSCNLTLAMVHERMSLVPFEHLSNMINEEDDAETADVILQTLLYKEVIFG